MPVTSDKDQPVTAAVRAALGHFQITSLSSAKTLVTGNSDKPLPAGAKRALLQAETQNVRWRDDSTAPTASVGMILIAGATPFEFNGDITAIQFIEVSSSAKLNVALYE